MTTLEQIRAEAVELVPEASAEAPANWARDAKAQSYRGAPVAPGRSLGPRAVAPGSANSAKCSDCGVTLGLNPSGRLKGHSAGGFGTSIANGRFRCFGAPVA